MKHRDMKRFQQIGVDRLIRLIWLSQTANLVKAGDDTDIIKKYLVEYIKNDFPISKATVRGSIDKTLTILMRIWARPPKDLLPLRDDGLTLLEQSSADEEIAIHWGMTMAVYPFWSAVAASVGRLLALQGQVVASQVQRRLREQYGERQTVSRSVRRLLRSFIDWQVLAESSVKGVYIQLNSLKVSNPRLISWLVEANLNSIIEDSIEFRSALTAANLFPFHLHPISANQLVLKSDGLDLFRQGLDQEIIMLTERD